MNMHYIRATVPADMHGTAIALLLTATDIVATEPAVTDAIAMAAFRTDASTETYRTAERAAIRIAASRCAIVDGPTYLWSSWQAGIEDPWPVLADMAGRYFGNDDAAAGIVPGRWIIGTPA